MRNAIDARSPATVQSVDRAMEIVELLSREGLRGATEVARALDIHKSTAFRLLATLQQHGIVEQDARTTKYQLGPRLVQLAATVTADHDLRAQARPVCERLAEVAGDTVTLDVMGSDDVLHIDQVVQSATVVNVNWLGRRTPLHCTASGKVFLAFAPEEVRARVLGARLEARTPHTIVDADLLGRQLAAIHAHGYGYTAEELELGLNALAAPVRSSDGRVKACLNLSGPVHRMPLERLLGFADLTMECAAEVSRRLGYRGA